MAVVTAVVTCPRGDTLTQTVTLFPRAKRGPVMTTWHFCPVCRVRFSSKIDENADDRTLTLVPLPKA
jgi:hypothetical protein